MPFNVGPMELIIVLVIALLILGPGKLPEVGAAFGKTIREFRKASTDIQETTNLATSPSTPAAPAAPVAQAAAVAPPAPAPTSTADEPAPLGTPADPVEERA
jgi:TatA/E family protein of Tat protein translocase